MSQLPLVFLPGMMCDARLYMHQIVSLSKRYALHFAPVCGKDSVREMAEEVLEHCPSRFVLLGLSLGGMVAMEILAQAADRVCGVVLLDTSPLADADDIRQIRERQIEQARAGHLRQLLLGQVMPLFHLEGENGAKTADIFLAMALGMGKEVFERQSRALQNRPDQQENLKKAGAPALILCGRNDWLCPLDVHQLMHNLMSNSQFEIIEDAGHMPTLEQPEATTAAIERWLERSITQTPGSGTEI